jgi:hypothetical protein
MRWVKVQNIVVVIRMAKKAKESNAISHAGSPASSKAFPFQ